MNKKSINPLDWDLGNVPPGIAWGGVDEAGRGAWAGPVVAACVVLDSETVKTWGHVLRTARDSKQMRPEKREALASELKIVIKAWAVSEVDNMAIDRENILEATLHAMRQAVLSAREKLVPKILFIDGDRAPKTGLPERLLVEGDATSCAIACASILAKAHRDELMRKMDEDYPGYAFGQHKGYGTKIHQTALKDHGACPIHRLSYAPVAGLQKANQLLHIELMETLETCDSVPALHQWVEKALRPAYGCLKQAWVESLRQRYAQRLFDLGLNE